VDIKLPFVNILPPKLTLDVAYDVVHMFVGVACPSFFSISTLKVSNQKYMKDNLCQQHVLAFIRKGSKTYVNPGYLLVVLCLSKVISSTKGTFSCSHIGGVLPISSPIIDESVKL
jgi:hypothetical protein